MNSPWSRCGAALAAALLLAGCGGGDDAQPARQADRADPAEADAQLLGQEVYDIMDRVIAFRSSHQGRLPTSFRQAGLDSLTGTFVRSLGRVGDDPLVTIRFRRPEDRALESCSGTNLVLEQAMMNEGTFEVQCAVTAGATRTFTVRRP